MAHLITHKYAIYEVLLLITALMLFGILHDDDNNELDCRLVLNK